MKKRPFLYTLGFAIIAIIACLAIIFIGFFVGKRDDDLSPVIDNEVSKITFVIDAGHGGEDAGAVAYDGTLEKDLNLKISTILAGLLELNGCSVKMTREKDTLLYDLYGDLQDYTGKKKVYDLKNRLRLASELEPSIYIGIHMNNFSMSKYSGLQVYYSQNNMQSKDIASFIRESNKLYLQPNNTRSIKKADSSIYILDKATIPAVLVECGFLSNHEELSLLKSDSYQRKLSIMLFSSCICYNK